jgi:hypothetical protein
MGESDDTETWLGNKPLPARPTQETLKWFLAPFSIPMNTKKSNVPSCTSILSHFRDLPKRNELLKVGCEPHRDIFTGTMRLSRRIS